MKWLLMAMLLVTAPAQATLIQYTFDVAARDPFSTPEPGTRSDMTLLVDTDSQKITSLIYKNIFFDISFQGEADIASNFWWLNEDGSGYFAITSTIWNILPDGGSVSMYLEASMPLGSNPAHFLDKGTDGQAFNFYTNEGVRTHVGYWSNSEKVIVPEPASLTLLGLGLALIWLRRR